MKRTIFIIALLYLSVSAFSETNKPTVGDFGIKVGVSLPNVGLGLTFSRRVKRNLECGASAGFSFTTSKSSQVTNVNLNTTNGWTTGNQEYTSRFYTYVVAVSPFLLYHIPINNNLDVFAGGQLSLSASHQINYTYLDRFYTTNYESKDAGKIHFPISFGAGASALLGADYYFRKNMAIGVSGSLGFSSLFQFGTQTEQVTHTNTGSLNPTQGTTYSEQKWTIKRIYTNTALSGSAGINFTFYFTRQGANNASSK